MRIPRQARLVLAIALLGLFTGAVIAAAGVGRGPAARSPGGTAPPAPPAPGPTRLTVWASKWPVPINGPEVDLAQVVSAFRASHPGVTVDVTLLARQDFRQRLTSALSAGDPPDVLLPPPGELALYDQGLQADLRLFLPRAGLESYLPEALAGCTRGGRLLALPRWVEGRAWVADAASLRRVGFDPGGTTAGWTWGEFERLCGRLKAAGPQPIIDPSSPELMIDLAYEPPAPPTPPAPAPPPPPGDGRPEVLSAPPAEMARSLSRRGLARIQVVGSASSRAIPAIASGDTPIVAGISPVLASEIVARFAGESYRPVLVPVPTSGVPRGPSLRVGGVLVFRRPEARGDERTNLAAELAEAISLAPWNPAMPVLMVPAATPLVGAWTEVHRWNAVVALASVRRGRAGPLPTAAELDLASAARERARIDLKRDFGRSR